MKKIFASGSRRKTITLVAALTLILALAIGGTIAWLTDSTNSVVNTFTPAHVACQVTEKFENNVKSNVNVTNTGDIDAYIRVKLVTYRTNDAGQHIGGTATLPEFRPGADWVKNGDYYYYTLPVAPNGQPAANLIDSITLTSSYNDADGGHQAIDVMAEAIQAQGTDSNGNTPVQLAWGVTISEGSVTAYTGN